VATWRSDTRHAKTFGSFSMVSQVNGRRETAHLIDLGHLEIRVLPDDRTSGAQRARVVKGALDQAMRLVGVSEDVITDCVLGKIARAGLSWELIESEEALEELLDDWVLVHGEEPAESLIRHLRQHSYQIVKVDE
jgi:hypothetical protein